MAKILITGTSKGIGYSSALQFARQGHEVIATMRNPNASDLGQVAADVSLHVDIRVLDVNDSASVDEVFNTVGDLDVLVNNAGILSFNTVEDENLDKFKKKYHIEK